MRLCVCSKVVTHNWKFSHVCNFSTDCAIQSTMLLVWIDTRRTCYMKLIIHILKWSDSSKMHQRAEQYRFLQDALLPYAQSTGFLRMYRMKDREQIRRVHLDRLITGEKLDDVGQLPMLKLVTTSANSLSSTCKCCPVMPVDLNFGCQFRFHWLYWIFEFSNFWIDFWIFEFRIWNLKL